MRGRWIEQRHGPDFSASTRAARKAVRWRAFVPDPVGVLEPSLSGPTSADVADAQEALGQLGDAVRSVSGLDVLARRLLRSEAVASSRVEAIVVPHRRLAEAEAGATGQRYETARQVIGNVRAMTRAIELGAQPGPLTVEHLESMHGLLMSASPYRDDQEWAGRLREEPSFIGGTSPATAEFVPPPHELLPSLLDDLLTFVNDRRDLSPVVVAAIAHAQFETIHPFHDGNGRVGRCLIHTVLRRHGSLGAVAPPVSLVIAQSGSAYVDGLTAFRTGDVDGWLSHFAVTVRRACEATLRFATMAENLHASWARRIHARRGEEGRRPLRADATARRLMAVLAEAPVLDAAAVVDRLGVTWKTALDAIEELAASGILVQTSVGRRNRVYEAKELFELLDRFEREPL